MVGLRLMVNGDFCEKEKSRVWKMLVFVWKTFGVIYNIFVKIYISQLMFCLWKHFAVCCCCFAITKSLDRCFV